MHPESFQTRSLLKIPAAGAVPKILAAAITAVEPGAAVHRVLHRVADRLTVVQNEYDLTRFRRVRIFAVGKAAEPMAAATAHILRDRLTGGIVISKDGHFIGKLPEELETFEAGHPVPDRRGVQATGQLVKMLSHGRPDDLAVCLISGGGSALLTLPAEGVSLAEIQALTGSLLASGADINAINIVRRCLSQVKGGRLAALAHPAKLITLILSDVIGDPLEAIASGPTVPSTTSCSDALRVLEKYGLELPGGVLAGLHGANPEAPGPGDPVFEQVQNVVIGSNRVALDAAAAAAFQEGFQVLTNVQPLSGEASDVGLDLAVRAAALPPGACLIAGGETTVSIGDNHGKGGRNQELALAAVSGMAGVENVLLVSLATDGDDGPTDAAGAVVTGETLARALRLSMDPLEYLHRHDSYPFFDSLGDLIRTGPTRTNVNDLVLLIKF